MGRLPEAYAYVVGQKNGMNSAQALSHNRITAGYRQHLPRPGDGTGCVDLVGVCIYGG
jgi:hypothetical protein